MKPDWKNAPSWANWRCKSSDGIWEFHEYRPTPGSRFWNSSGRIVTAGRESGNGVFIDWVESLGERK